MSSSYSEQIVCLLTSICAILCFGFGFNVAGWVFFVKAVIDYISSWIDALRDSKSGTASFFWEEK